MPSGRFYAKLNRLRIDHSGGESSKPKPYPTRTWNQTCGNVFADLGLPKAIPTCSRLKSEAASTLSCVGGIPGPKLCAYSASASWECPVFCGTTSASIPGASDVSVPAARSAGSAVVMDRTGMGPGIRAGSRSAGWPCPAHITARHRPDAACARAKFSAIPPPCATSEKRLAGGVRVVFCPRATHRIVRPWLIQGAHMVARNFTLHSDELRRPERRHRSGRDTQPRGREAAGHESTSARVRWFLVANRHLEHL